MSDYLNLKDKTFVVFGASSGIGAETALLLDSLGGNVILVARREKELIDILGRMQGRGNRYYTADVSDLSGIEPLVKKIVTECGLIHGVVYSVGMTLSMPLQMFTPEKLQKIFTTNFFAFVECVRQVCKKGRYQKGMHIVGVSSVAANRGDKAHLGYSASKAAMDAAVRCIATEVANKGIRINTIAPGMTKTDMYEGFLEKNGEDSATNQNLLTRQYLGLAEKKDVANAIAFLLSERSDFVTGISFPVDGGYSTS